MNPRAKIALMLLAGAALVWLVVAPVYLALPDSIPAHLNFAGEVDRWGSKVEVLIMPLVYTVGAVFAVLIVWAAPEDISEEHEGLSLALIAVFVLIALMHPVGAFLAMDEPTSISRYMDLFVGLMLLILGTGLYLSASKLRPNPWFGLRLPATMQSRKAWVLGNRLAGALLAAHGLGVVALVLWNAPAPWITAYLLGGLLVIVVVASVYAVRMARG